MRGDSLRDFYAKTLAVVGLGLLAGAGAIVDYWPVNEELPTTPAVTGLVAEAPQPVVGRDLTAEIPAPVIRIAQSARPADFINVNVIGSGWGGPIVVLTPEVTLDAAPPPPDFIAAEERLSVLGTAANVDTFDLASPPIADNMTDDSRRFGDTLRRTKQSLAAARSFLNDAMSGVAGAFRKVSPFFTTTPIVPGLD